MQVKFEIREADYTAFLKAYFFKRILKNRLVFIILGALWCSLGREHIESIVLGNLIFKVFCFVLVLFLVLVVIPYFIARIKLQKAFKANPSALSHEVLLQKDGIKIVTEKEEVLLKWLAIKTTGHTSDYVFVHMLSGKFYIFPYRVFSSANEALQFLTILEHNVEKNQSEIKNRKIRNLHYLGLLGFIPNVGLVIGIILLVKGVEYKKKSLILIGIGGILFTALFWFVLLKFLIPTLAPISIGA